MDIFGILDPDTDPHENLCGSETLVEGGVEVGLIYEFRVSHF